MRLETETASAERRRSGHDAAIELTGRVARLEERCASCGSIAFHVRGGSDDEPRAYCTACADLETDWRNTLKRRDAMRAAARRENR
jgi:hypothetical protein